MKTWWNEGFIHSFGRAWPGGKNPDLDIYLEIFTFLFLKVLIIALLLEHCPDIFSQTGFFRGFCSWVKLRWAFMSLNIPVPKSIHNHAHINIFFHGIFRYIRRIFDQKISQNQCRLRSVLQYEHYCGAKFFSQKIPVNKNSMSPQHLSHLSKSIPTVLAGACSMEVQLSTLPYIPGLPRDNLPTCDHEYCKFLGRCVSRARVREILFVFFVNFYDLSVRSFMWCKLVCDHWHRKLHKFSKLWVLEHCKNSVRSIPYFFSTWKRFPRRRGSFS